MNQTPVRQSRKRSILVATTIMAVAALSGCVGTEDGPAATPEALADLQVDRTERYAGEPFFIQLTGIDAYVTSDAPASADAASKDDGSTEAAVSDDPERAYLAVRFGDGTTVWLDDLDADARDTLQHRYVLGGVYAIELVLMSAAAYEAAHETDSGSDDDNASQADGANATQPEQTVALEPIVILAASTVLVHERVALEDATVAALAIPVPDADPSVKRHNISAENSTASFEFDLEVRSQGTMTPTNVTVRLMDAAGVVLANHSIVIDGDATTPLVFRAAPMNATNHTLEIVAYQGTATIGGELRVFHGMNAAAPETA